MVSPPLVHSFRLSSIGPGQVTGQDVAHDPTNIDLAMKLHYLRYVYYFTSQAVDGLRVHDYKAVMFKWFDRYYVTSGRFRRAESGRPYIKCNDCGVRLIEALCEKTLDEWLEIKDGSMENLLVYGQVIGPEMHFSPIVLMQLTTFKCGGLSMGLSWAHVLGDAFVAADSMALLGPVMSGQHITQLPNHIQMHTKPKSSQSPPKDPLSVKKIDPVGDYWKITNHFKMETFSFNLIAKQISHIQSKVRGENGNELSAFESLCAVVWKSVAKTRTGSKPKLVTICKKGTESGKTNIFGNDQVISVVEAEFPAIDANLYEIGRWLGNRMMDDRGNIEEAVERDHGVSDFVFYGANLTFLDLEGANIYGFELKGNKPVYVSCTLDGVGEEGVVLVIPDGKGGKVVTLIMPENEVLELKLELKKEFELL